MCAMVSIACLFVGSGVVVGTIGLIRETLRGELDASLLFVTLPSAFVAWMIATALPVNGVLNVRRGRGRRGAVLIAVSGLYCALTTVLGAGVGAEDTVRVLVSAVLLLAGAVLAWRAGPRAAPDGRRSAEVLGKRRSARSARVLVMAGGWIGLHAFYLRRSWEGTLLAGLFALAFVSWNFVPVWIFVAVGVSILIVDYLAADGDIETLNAG